MRKMNKEERRILIIVIDKMHDWRVTVSNIEEKRRLLILIIRLTRGKRQYQTKKKIGEIVNIDYMEY